MIYLIHGTDRAICESEKNAARLEARGWIRTTHAEHAIRWQIADAVALAQMYAELNLAPQSSDAPRPGPDHYPGPEIALAVQQKRPMVFANLRQFRPFED